MRNLFKIYALASVTYFMASCCGSQAVADYQIIPMPREIANKQGENPYTLSSSTVIYYKGDGDMARNAQFLASYIEDIAGYKLKVVSGEGDGIELSLSDDITSSEGYEIEIEDDGIEIKASTPQGIFYGIQTLRKSIPADMDKGSKVSFSAVEIDDAPRFGYRGVMLDVARHIVDVDSVKRFIDIMALHNQNNLHLHLNDDQGWRIEIEKYPLLTEIGSKRKETVIGKNTGKYDGKPYEGYYTKDDIRDIIAYAGDRYITVIPEIDLPGHQLAALAAYPHMGCTGGPYEVEAKWGVMDDVICAGNEESMQFLEDVLTEVVELFPSQYIHIGGDECPKRRWEKCPKCQAKIKALGIKGDKKHSAEEYLQSYVISRMEQHVASLGRDIIGWDEILEGGIAPNATVMSWRGTEGGIEAARQRHNVIMSPTTYLYLDYYQTSDIESEPIAIGGLLPISKVYSYEPVEEELTAEEANYIIGVQANLWSEYFYQYWKFEYMALPRLAAAAEIQWSDPKHKDFPSFLARTKGMLKFYDLYDYLYARHIFDLHPKVAADYDNKEIVITLEGIGDIRYTLDGTTPTVESTLYTEPLRIKESAQVRAAIIASDGTSSKLFSEDINFNKATFKPIVLTHQGPDWSRFSVNEELNNGLKGNSVVGTGRWLGYKEGGMEATIDLGEQTSVEKVAYGVNIDQAEWATNPVLSTVAISNDGKNFKEVAREEAQMMKESDKSRLEVYTLTVPKTEARYVRLYVSSGNMPAWHEGAGQEADLLIDEIEIY